MKEGMQELLQEMVTAVLTQTATSLSTEQCVHQTLCCYRKRKLLSWGYRVHCFNKAFQSVDCRSDCVVPLTELKHQIHQTLLRFLDMWTFPLWKSEVNTELIYRSTLLLNWLWSRILFFIFRGLIFLRVCNLVLGLGGGMHSIDNQSAHHCDTGYTWWNKPLGAS